MKKLKPDSRTAEAAAKLRALAHDLGPQAKLPTVRQLKSDLGVSLATLDSALSHLEREGVVKRRHGLGLYVDSDIAVSRIALVYDPAVFFARSSSPFWNILLESIFFEGGLRDKEIAFHLIHYGEFSDDPTSNVPEALPPGLVADIQHRRVDGVIAVGLAHGIYNALADLGAPVITFAGFGRYSLLMDVLKVIEPGFEEARQHGDLRPHLWLSGHIDLAKVDALAEKTGLKGYQLMDSSIIRKRAVMGKEPSLTQVGINASRNLQIPRGSQVTLISTDDMFSQGLLMGLRRRGLEPRRDFHMFTHANEGAPTLLGWEKDISSAIVDPRELARLLLIGLDHLIERRDFAESMSDFGVFFNEEDDQWAVPLPYTVVPSEASLTSAHP